MKWDVTKLAEDWYSTNHPNCGLLVKDCNEFESNPNGQQYISSTCATFCSSECKKPAYRPYLEVTYVPEKTLLTNFDAALTKPDDEKRNR